MFLLHFSSITMQYSEGAISFKAQVNSAMLDQIPWEMLLTFMESLCLTLEKSKEVNYVLLDELKTYKQTPQSSLPHPEVDDTQQNGDSSNVKLETFVIKEEKLDPLEDAEGRVKTERQKHRS